MLLWCNWKTQWFEISYVAGSNPVKSTKLNQCRRTKMKKVYFENIVNKEKFYCTDIKDIMLIEGVEYIRVFKYGTQRDCLVKKDILRKINEKNIK